MPKKLTIAIAQLNLPVGDIAGNLQKHIAAAEKARDTMKADVIVFPELSLTGYPPEDLLLSPAFLHETERALATLQEKISGIHCIIGHPQRSAKGLLNSASVLHNGQCIATYSKRHLPNYGVFDEKRYFIPGESSALVIINDIPVSILICEDLWFNTPAKDAASSGAKLILSPNASPFELNKQDRRIDTLSKRSKSAGIPIFYVNCVGGQDDLLFDGNSMVFNGQGELCQQASHCEEALLSVDVNFDEDRNALIAKKSWATPSEDEKIYSALVLGTRDYIQKNHFKKVLLGLSGGIDSALALCIAVDAIGSENVHAIMMPSRFTSDISKQDASELAKNLSVDYQEISIENSFQSFLTTLDPVLGTAKSPLVDQNLQARCRGMILMALSNNMNALVLTTSNRSELAMGYSTLYGDMAGGFCILKDVPKLLVYRLSQYRNTKKSVIPARILEREPSAELAPNQKDEDTLPPYPILDKILYLYLNQLKSAEEIIEQGFDKETVERVVRSIRINEYKRRQAPIGLRIDNFAFGRDRRFPVSNQFKC